MDNIIVPVFYSVDENSDRIIDEDSIRDEFERQLKEMFKKYSQDDKR